MLSSRPREGFGDSQGGGCDLPDDEPHRSLRGPCILLLPLHNGNDNSTRPTVLLGGFSKILCSTAWRDHQAALLSPRVTVTIIMVRIRTIPRCDLVQPLGQQMGETEAQRGSGPCDTPRQRGGAAGLCSPLGGLAQGLGRAGISPEVAATSLSLPLPEPVSNEWFVATFLSTVPR